jgi:glycosyltransferase involved in cell wall biosynthesis
VGQPLSAARWVCCHLGAREHYAVPRALHRHRRLHLLITDAWAAPGSLWQRLPGAAPRRLSERFHSDLVAARIHAFTGSLLVNEAMWRSQQSGGWEMLIARNAWFGRRAAAALSDISMARDRATVVFAHSYAARDVFAYAKSRGWTTVLGQIDPGPEHCRIAEQVADQHPEYGSVPELPPPAYFEAWREECRLADWIVVNSEWSRDALAADGVPCEKLRVVPLPYEPEITGTATPRQYPPSFTPQRPLRALFVGTASVIKGVAALLEAIEQLADVPVELTVVGGVSMTVPQRLVDHQSIRWVGAVPRLEVMRYYQDSDVLVFPSLSDGFGMAQVEAQGSGLPIIASRSCGRVVVDGVNGILLPEVSAAAIAAAIRTVAANPRLLSGFAQHSAPHQQAVTQLGDALLQLEPEATA